MKDIRVITSSVTLVEARDPRTNQPPTRVVAATAIASPSSAT
ncbi:hypothetical protein [Streptomyces sp. UG1]